MKQLFSACLLVSLLCAAAAAQTPLAEIRKESKHIDRAGAAEAAQIKLFPLGAGGVLRKVIPRQAGASSLRLHFVLLPAPNSPASAALPAIDAVGWSLRVIDADGRDAWTFTPAAGAPGNVWSDELAGDRATVVLTQTAPGVPPPLLMIDRVAKGTAPTRDESIIRPNDLVLLANVANPALKKLGKAVARLRFVGDDGGVFFCTGFLVTRDLFFTNNHCISSETEMRSALADFDFDNDITGVVPGGARFVQLVATDPVLDFSLLRLAIPEPASRGFLRLDPTLPPADEALMIIQHPNGEPKRLSRVRCTVLTSNEGGLAGTPTDFSHVCDTDGGSSGSPVFQGQTSKVVGLHHLGFDEKTGQRFNRAVQMGLIIRALRPAVAAEITSQ
jgi:hypothetical protein